MIIFKMWVAFYRYLILPIPMGEWPMSRTKASDTKIGSSSVIASCMLHTPC